MPIAALYDIHGNLPALEAVLEDIARAGADRVVVGGDVVPGPMPRETLIRLLELDLRNSSSLLVMAKLAVLAEMNGRDSGDYLPDTAIAFDGMPHSFTRRKANCYSMADHPVA